MPGRSELAKKTLTRSPLEILVRERLGSGADDPRPVAQRQRRLLRRREERNEILQTGSGWEAVVAILSMKPISGLDIDCLRIVGGGVNRSPPPTTPTLSDHATTSGCLM